jgi:hypothetical protein
LFPARLQVVGGLIEAAKQQEPKAWASGAGHPEHELRPEEVRRERREIPEMVNTSSESFSN